MLWVRSPGPSLSLSCGVLAPSWALPLKGACGLGTNGSAARRLCLGVGLGGQGRQSPDGGLDSRWGEACSGKLVAALS